MAAQAEIITSTSRITPPLSNSPCIRNCCLDGKKVCLGCGRSLAEILEWHRADDNRQYQISLKAQQRLSKP